MLKEKERTCCICGKKFKGYGNNPDPIKTEGVCCDECNDEVIKQRIIKSIELWKV